MADLIQERIAKPLHLQDTYLVDGNASAGRKSELAHGYEPDAARTSPRCFPRRRPPGPLSPAPPGPRPTSTPPRSTPARSGPPADRLHRRGLGPLRQRAAVGQAAAPGVAQGNGDHRPRRSPGPGPPLRSWPGTGVHSVRHRLGPRRSGCRLLQWAYTDDTGTRTASVFVATIFGLATPKAAGANQILVNAAVCTMLGKPTPASSPTPAG